VISSLRLFLLLLLLLLLIQLIPSDDYSAREKIQQSRDAEI